MKNCSYDFSLYKSVHDMSQDAYIFLKMFMDYSYDYNDPVSVNENT